MLDINKRVRCEGTTVAEMIEALQSSAAVASGWHCPFYRKKERLYPL